MATMMRSRRLCPPSGVSLLERLMRDNTLYQQNPDTGHFDSRYVTKLLQNYRYIYHTPPPPSPFCSQLVQKWDYGDPPAGHTLPSWEFPTRCSIKMSCRCVLTRWSARPTATGMASRRRFVMKWRRAAGGKSLMKICCNAMQCKKKRSNQRREFDDASMCLVSCYIRVSPWSSTGWWARTRERPTVRLSST